MSNNIYTAGLKNVGSYQVSGAPFATGSLNVYEAGPNGLKIEFPYVTSWIQIYNLSTDRIHIGFSSEGVQNNNYFVLQRSYNAAQGGRVTNYTGVLPLKVTEIWLSASTFAPQNLINVDIVAGLTNIPVGRVTAASPSGSNWSGSVGVG